MSGRTANTFEGPAAARMLWLANEFIPKSGSWTFNPATGATLGLEGDDSLDISGKVTLLAGSLVKVSTNSPTSGLHIGRNGTLNAQGTKSAPIIFTSVLDDTVGGDTNVDGDASSAQPGSYTSAITMRPGSKVAVDYATFSYALDGIADATGAKRSTELTVDNATFRDNRYFGIDINAGLTTAVIEGSSFDSNGLGAVHFSGGSSPIGFAMSGKDANTFSGPAAAHQVWLAGANVASGDRWTFDSTKGAIMALEFANSLEVEGMVTIKAGTKVKVSSNSRFSGLSVLDGGVLRATGTKDEPILISSVLDDSIAGDTNGDQKATKPSAGDFRSAIRIGAGSRTSLDHVKIRYARSAITDQAPADSDDADGSASAAAAILTVDNSVIRDSQYYGIVARHPFSDIRVNDTTIRDSTTAIGGFDGKITFRGTLHAGDDTSFVVRACNFGKSCSVDANQSDWGSATGPYTEDGAPMVCGQVTVNQWEGHSASDAGIDFVSQENC